MKANYQYWLQLVIAVVFLQLLLPAASAQSVKSATRIIGDSVHVDFTNPYHAPIEFLLSFPDSLKSVVQVKSLLVLPALSTVADVFIYPETDTTAVRASLRAKGNFGYAGGVQPDKNFEYLLPYPKGKKYSIMQSFNGRFSHSLPHSKYAVDFALPIGDTVTAARAGTVVIVKMNSKEHGPTRDFADKANKIIVLHADGTYGHYVHFAYQHIFVEEGQQISEGQPLGLVGLSGFTTKPHLHFVVMKERGLAVPIRYRGVKHKKPKLGKWYKNKERQ